MLDTFVEAAIKMESPSGTNERPRWLFGGSYYTGIGPAKVSDAEMEGKYGKLVDDEHEKVGLGLRDGPCDRWRGCAMDQNTPLVAAIAMKTRLSMRLDECVKNGCTTADMVMVATLAADERITPNTLKLAFEDDRYNSTNESVVLDWNKFLKDNWTKPKDRQKNKKLINLFSNNVQDLQSQNFPAIDWDYIDGLTQWEITDYIAK